MQVMNVKSSNDMNHKLPKFIAPGMLAKGRGYGKKVYRVVGESSGTLVPTLISLIFFTEL